MKNTYTVHGMSCEGCQSKISEALNAIEGIHAKVDLKSNIVEIESKEPIDLNVLNQKLQKTGHYHLMEAHHSHESTFIPPQDRVSPSSVYYCPMECEGDKVYFQQGKRCPVCNMYLVPIEEKESHQHKPLAYSKTNLPESFKHSLGKYFCPMFCEGDKVYDEPGNCSVCHMHLEKITEDLLQHAHFITPMQHPKPEGMFQKEENAGKYYCPMFCEGDKVYDSNVGCPICGMDLVMIPTKDGSKEDKTCEKLRTKFWIAVLFSLPVVLLSMGGMWIKWPFSNEIQGYLQLLFSLPVIFYSGWFLIQRGYRSFKTSNLNMFSLIFLGAIAAFLFSLVSLFFPSILPEELIHGGKVPLYFESVVVILTLVIMGQMFEAKAHQKTGKAIEELIKLSPETANLVKDGVEKVIDLAEVQLGDILRVKAGEKIPVDGKIIEGESYIDESMITGEPIPMAKTIDDSVTSGTINENGTFLMKAEKIGEDTLLSQIIKMVGDASRSKAPIQKLADKISSIFVPAVILISLLTFAGWFIFGSGENRLIYAIINAVSVLIVACPCALGLATPMSLMVGIGKSAQNGILIKDAESLERMHKVNVLITDKTGTLTEGKPSVDSIETIPADYHNEILQIAASLSMHSMHPLSKAILNKYKSVGDEMLPIHGFENTSGKGVSGKNESSIYLMGNLSLMNQFGINIPAELIKKAVAEQNNAKTISYVAKDTTILGFLSFSDKIKETSKSAIKLLQNQKMEIIMLTGDNEHTAKAVAREVGIQRFKANCLPEDKMKEIKKLQSQGKIVAMTGDGINDAPALAQADIGIAMGTGSDAAIESAAITLVKGDILGVAKAKVISEKLIKNIRENLFFAFIYNMLGIPIAAGVLYPFFGILLSPMIAAAAMSFSSLSVILNSLRLNRMKF